MSDHTDTTLTDTERADLLCADPECPECRETEAACLRIVAARVAAARADERAQWRFVIASQAEELARYDCTDNPDDVPTYVDVPDDYEAGIHGAARVLRALIERVDQ